MERHVKNGDQGIDDVGVDAGAQTLDPSFIDSKTTVGDCVSQNCRPAKVVNRD
jgi:hypothetical protein